MQTARFKVRKDKLSKIFDKTKITNVWRKIVRDQLRNLDLKDLYDNYDFNYNIEERASSIRTEILNANYKADPALVYRIEKKFGICRHLVIPNPTDSLVLQVLVENIADEILINQPSKNAFYSRDKNQISKPHETGEYFITKRELWKQLQKKIYKFNEEKELIIVTDLSNYYDSIDIPQIRKVFTSYAKIDEVLIDLLFKIIEQISWNPDYLPYMGKGLPTTNIEAIRLLAHCFLFEIDIVLKEKTNDCFTRWMDDINIGANSKKEAIEILSEVSDMLKSRGLALNMAKTNIYTSELGYYHFQIDENKYLDRIQLLNRNDENFNNEIKKFNKNFRLHFKNQSAKYWDKVTKRYITTYSKFKLSKLLESVSKMYVEYPSLRQNLLYYLSDMGYSIKSSNIVLQILLSIDIFDDISLYQLCNLVTKWEIPISKHSTQFLQNFEKYITDFSFKRKLPYDFYCVLWFKAKYNNATDLLFFIGKFQNIWQSNSFLRRQVTSVLGRLLFNKNARANSLLAIQLSSGINNTVTLANQILFFSQIESLDFKLNSYLFPTNVQKPYPLSKFLVLCSVLNSTSIRINEDIKNKIMKNIFDPYYLNWLKIQYNIF